MELGLFVVVAFLASVCAGWIAIPRIVLISKKKKLFDELSERKSHVGAIPRLGGTAFFPSFLFSIVLVLGLRYYYGFGIALLLETSALTELFFLIAGLTVLFFVGMMDDLTGLSYRVKFIAQIFVAILLLYGGVGIENLGGLFGIHHIPAAVGGILTVLIVVLLTNAYNLIDGIDGLCSGLSLLTLFALGGWFVFHDLYVYAMFSMAMAGVVCVFFFYNVMGRRMKVFMGDTGSLALGYMIAFLALKFYDLNIESPLYSMEAIPAVVMGLVFVPAFDTMRVFCVRIYSGLSPFHPDKRHIHHKLLRLGLNHFQSSMIIIAIQGGFILLNFLLRNVDVNVLFCLDLLLGIFLIQVLNALGGRREKRLSKQ